MKTSFYFVLWIAIYVLIDIFGSPFLQNNSFFVAIAAVYAISFLCQSLMSNQIAYLNKSNYYSFLEVAYNNDYRKFKGIHLRKFIFETITFVYFIVTVIFLLMIHDSWFIIAIFAFFAFSSGKRMYADYMIYKMIKEEGQIPFPEDDDQMAQIKEYFSQRDKQSFEEIIGKPTLKDQLFRWSNVVFSVISMLLGLVFIGMFLPGLFVPGVERMGSIMLFLYGSLAFIYGLNDLIPSIKGYNTAAD